MGKHMKDIEKTLEDTVKTKLEQTIKDELGKLLGQVGTKIGSTIEDQLDKAVRIFYALIEP